MKPLQPIAVETGTSPAAEAVEWLLRIERRQLNETEKARFEAWRAVPENGRAYAKALSVWDAVDEVAADPEILRVRESILERMNWRRVYLTAGVAAGVAALVIVSFALTTSLGISEFLAALFDRGSFAEAAVATTVGERSTTTLHDGSTLTLDTDSVAQVAFNTRERKIVLTRGQALFEVAKNDRRPFVVYAGDRRIVATGTAFDVRLDRASVEVTLVEGHLLVGQAEGPAERQGMHAQAELQAGERLVARSGTVSVSPANLAGATSWTMGKLIFLDTRLADAVAEVNRYTRTPIGLNDPALLDLKVNGVFRSGLPAEFARAIAEIYPLGVETGVDGRIHISAKPK